MSKKIYNSLQSHSNTTIHNTEQIGQRLRELRNYLGIGRRCLETLTQIPQSTIRSWEEGYTNIRTHNLEKYLNELMKLGCSTTLEWVLYGDKLFPHRQDNEKFLWLSSQYDIRKVDTGNILALLQTTSNLFYYLDTNENIICINKHFLFCLDHVLTPEDNLAHNIEFKKLCSKEVYNICHKHFVLCKQENQRQNFTYSTGTQYGNQKTIVDMLYWPLTEGAGYPPHGVLGFISSNTISQLNIIS